MKGKKKSFLEERVHRIKKYNLVSAFVICAVVLVLGVTALGYTRSGSRLQDTKEIERKNDGVISDDISIESQPDIDEQEVGTDEELSKAPMAAVNVAVNLSNPQTGQGYEYNITTKVITLNDPDALYTVTGTTDGAAGANRIEVNTGGAATVIFDGVNITKSGSISGAPLSVASGTKLYLQLKGENKLTSDPINNAGKAGIQVAAGAEINIDTAEGSSDGAIEAKGGRYAAGIGGNENEDGGVINIGVNSDTGLKVTAIGGGGLLDAAAGIGGGGSSTAKGGAGGTITIAGGAIEAVGGTHDQEPEGQSLGSGGAGIGGGSGPTGGGSGGKILISNVASLSAEGGFGSEGRSSTVLNSRGASGAGIGGGGRSGESGEIRLENNSKDNQIVATGDEGSAGIGSGGPGDAVNGGIADKIEIISSNVKATGGNAAAGIGSGAYGECKSILISDSEIVAESNTSGAAIGGGLEGNVRKILIQNGSKVDAKNLTPGDFAYGAGIGGGQSSNVDDIEIVDSIVEAESDRAAGIGGGDGHTVVVGTIRISGSDITAKGGMFSSGIGNADSLECGVITIEDNSLVKADSGELAAGIGGGTAGCEAINITDSTVVATAGIDEYADGAPGIGNGADALDGTVIKILNSDVTAAGSYDKTNGGMERSAAAIGGAYGRPAGDITIENSKINAKAYKGSAAIGGSEDGAGGNIKIVDSELELTPGEDAAAIGSGQNGTIDNITVSGIIENNVKLKGGEHGAAIGSGKEGQVDIITVTGGVFEAEGGTNAAAIGSGQNAAHGSITITGNSDSDLTLQGGAGGAAIGGGENASGGTIIINSSSKLQATGGIDAAGIGGGKGGAGGNITIDGGQLTAIGGDGASGSTGGAGVGGGAGGAAASSINVSNDTKLYAYSLLPDKPAVDVAQGNYTGGYIFNASITDAAGTNPASLSDTASAELYKYEFNTNNLKQTLHVPPKYTCFAYITGNAKAESSVMVNTSGSPGQLIYTDSSKTPVEKLISEDKAAIQQVTWVASIGDIALIVPDKITFGGAVNIISLIKPMEYKVTNMEPESLKVKDTRLTKSKWDLSVSIDEPLKHEDYDSNGEVLNNVLYFHDGTDYQEMDGVKQLVYRAENNEAECDFYNDIWYQPGDDQGLYIKLKPAQAKQGKYVGKLKWTLEDTP